MGKKKDGARAEKEALVKEILKAQKSEKLSTKKTVATLVAEVAALKTRQDSLESSLKHETHNGVLAKT